MQVGSLAGFPLGSFLSMRAQADAKQFEHFEGTAKSVIHMAPGGWSQQETFDPKPLSPLEYRGEMGTVETALPGVRFNQHLKTAKIADKITVIRSMTHGERSRARDSQYVYRVSASPAVTYPSFGSVVSTNSVHEQIFRRMSACQTTGTRCRGWLPWKCVWSFTLGSDPSNNFTVRDLSLPGGVDTKRFESRRHLRNVVGRHFNRLEAQTTLWRWTASINERTTS